MILVNEGKRSGQEVLDEMERDLREKIALFSNPNPAGKITNEKISYGLCPKCRKGQIYANIKGYGCSEYKAGCTFFISGKIAGKAVSESLVKKLLQSGKTEMLRGFTGKNGKFSARLVLKEDKTIGFSFK